MKPINIEVYLIEELEKQTIRNNVFNPKNWCLRDIDQLEKIVRFLKSELLTKEDRLESKNDINRLNQTTTIKGDLEMADKDYVLKCNRLPVLVTIEGEGCIEIGTEGIGIPNRICGPASVPLTNINVGIVKAFAIPSEGYELTNAMGIPKGKNTSINKPYFRFYYDGKFLTAGKDDQMLKLTFRFKPIAGYSMPPAGNILGI